MKSGIFSAHPEHEAGPEHPVPHVNLPVVELSSEGLRTPDAGGSIAPVGVEGYPCLAASFVRDTDLLGRVTLIPHPTQPATDGIRAQNFFTI